MSRQPSSWRRDISGIKGNSGGMNSIVSCFRQAGCRRVSNSEFWAIPAIGIWGRRWIIAKKIIYVTAVDPPMDFNHAHAFPFIIPFIKSCMH